MPVFDWVLHLDLDQFIAAVEVRRRPELRGLPVVVGGDGDPKRLRQVVATASYEARRFGVRSGMPLSTAARRCPDAVFLPSDRSAYDEASAEVWAVVRELPVVVEVWGWDEGFLGTDDPDPVALARRARDLVAARTGLTCCIGVGDNKLTAKLATGFAKAPPGADPSDAPGVAVLTGEEWPEVMGPRPVDALWGVGARTAAKLGELGIRTVDELARADQQVLAARFGPRIGPWLGTLGRGEASRDVSDVPWVARGRSKEETYTQDLTDRTAVEEHLRVLARAVTEEVAADGRTVTHVGIKVRFVPFWTATRVTRLRSPTTDGQIVADTAVRLLDRFDPDAGSAPGERPVRLLGVRVELAPPAAARFDELGGPEGPSSGASSGEP